MTTSNANFPIVQAQVQAIIKQADALMLEAHKMRYCQHGESSLASLNAFHPILKFRCTRCQAWME